MKAEDWPRQGEIRFLKWPTDPPDKGPRPVIIVSLDSRNRHERATTALVVPLTTSVHRESPFHVRLPAGETGLRADSAARAEDVTAVLKRDLHGPVAGLRRVSHGRICELARKIVMAMGCSQ